MNDSPASHRPFETLGDATSAASGRLARQVVLPFGKSFEISVKSLRVRFFRSLITVMSLVLAVAFLAFTLLGHDVAMGLLASGDPSLQTDLVKAGFDLAPGRYPGSYEVASSAKDRWIVILSLLVCAVGIVNAQLMAVTERFREIGTMKCLGALDSFVLRLFLLEAGMQGLAGALAGAVIGGLVGLLAGVLRFGLPALYHLHLADAASSVGWSVLVGFVLSLIGVSYPALVASRMPPVAAMRAEE
ncbi:ABC transporter permease [Fundidesulfovibrio terrae]|uniref:ABC transporter permease n=1 Tax=Fundidesulfovibrio terrae TaxID=2922866 RepID=UPI001FAF176E|nr:FtsX-like permease family protein [Fundidesulfovibrio terrae]